MGLLGNVIADRKDMSSSIGRTNVFAPTGFGDRVAPGAVGADEVEVGHEDPRLAPGRPPFRHLPLDLRNVTRTAPASKTSPR